MTLDCNVREFLKKLISEKEEIEKELNVLNEVLRSQKNVGMTEPLVDKDQFPRNDIDVITVRHARHKILCLQNDHKKIMKEIEVRLHELHNDTNNSYEKIDDELMQLDVGGHLSQKDTSIPFASIGNVEIGSPAEIGGLQSGDLLIQFGSLNNKNFNSLQDFAKIVQHNKGRSLHVIVSRNFKAVSLSVKPNNWSGNGLLGCNVLSLKS